MSDPDQRSFNLVPEGADHRPPALSAAPADGRGWLVTCSVAALVVAIACGAAWYLYSDQLMRPDNGPIPVIRADPTPVRVRPENPGGMQVKHTDKMIFSRGGARVELEPGAERLLDPPEKPFIVMKSQPAAPEPGAVSPDAGPAPASGDYRVQLSAFPDETAATSEWNRLRTAFPLQLADLELMIEPVRQDETATLYRIQAGWIDQASARRICARLTAAGQSCQVVQP